MVADSTAKVLLNLERETVGFLAPGTGRTLASTDPSIGSGAEAPTFLSPPSALNRVWVGWEGNLGLPAG